MLNSILRTITIDNHLHEWQIKYLFDLHYYNKISPYIYHSATHMINTYLVSDWLCKEYKLQLCSKEIVNAIALWHDIAYLYNDIPNHHKTFASTKIIFKYLINKVNDKDLFSKTIFFLDKQTLTSKEDSIEAYIICVSDFISQCAHSLYIPMLKALNEDFQKISETSHTQTNDIPNSFNSIENLLYDEFIYKHIEPVLKEAFEYLKNVNLHNISYENFQYSKEIRYLCRQKNIMWSDLENIIVKKHRIDINTLEWVNNENQLQLNDLYSDIKAF